MTDWTIAHCHPEAQPKDLATEHEAAQPLAAQILHFVQDDKLPLCGIPFLIQKGTA